MQVFLYFTLLLSSQVRTLLTTHHVTLLLDFYFLGNFPLSSILFCGPKRTYAYRTFVTSPHPPPLLLTPHLPSQPLIVKLSEPSSFSILSPNSILNSQKNLEKLPLLH